LIAAIPLLSDTRNDYLDLRYALRGLEKFVNPEKVYLIGGKPTWIKGVKWIAYKDAIDTKFREKNIFDKLCACPADNFLYFSDDNFLLAPWVEKRPYDGRLENKMYNLPRGSTYRNTIVNTMRYGHKTFNYDVHVPSEINKEILFKMKKMPWGQDHGFCLKTLYAAFAGIEGTPCADMKIRKGDNVGIDLIRSRAWFSTDDGIVETMVDVMEELYPKPSKWEA
jgi:hypothetical protein